MHTCSSTTSFPSSPMIRSVYDSHACRMFGMSSELEKREKKNINKETAFLDFEPLCIVQLA